MDDNVIDRRDLDFLLYDVFKIETLLTADRFAGHDRGTFDAAVDLAIRIAEDVLWPNARAGDTEEPQLENGDVRISGAAKAGIAAVVDGGFIAASADEADGGLQLPMVVTQACLGILKGADPATVAYCMLTRAAANMLRAHATQEQRVTWAQPLFEGRWFGTMCLSEPDVGSSLGDIRTRANPHEDGTYRIRGNKMWISGADQDVTQNIVHLVLAKLPGAPPGARGLSLFIVPKRLLDSAGLPGARNDVRVAGLNHKFGYRATSNAALNFGENGACVGYLVGQPHKGLSYMFHMMNEARIGVGTGATMAAYAGYRQSLHYARERLQGRPAGADPASPPRPIIEHADVRRMLLQQKSYAEGGLALCLYGAFMLDLASVHPDRRAGLETLLEVLTPIIKAWPSEFGLEANKQAIQVHGGYGYTRDFMVEKLYRDNRLNAIHEGTTGIQALDFLGRKVLLDGGSGWDGIIRIIRGEIGNCTNDPALGCWAKALGQALDSVSATVASVVAEKPGSAPHEGLSHATQILFAVGHVVIGWLWLWQARVAGGLQPRADAGRLPFLRGKVAAARYFFDYELPRVDAFLSPARSQTGCLSDIRETEF